MISQIILDELLALYVCPDDAVPFALCSCDCISLYSLRKLQRAMYRLDLGFDKSIGCILLFRNLGWIELDASYRGYYQFTRECTRWFIDPNAPWYSLTGDCSFEFIY